jgi:hypothetical protein
MGYKRKATDEGTKSEGENSGQLLYVRAGCDAKRPRWRVTKVWDSNKQVNVAPDPVAYIKQDVYRL